MQIEELEIIFPLGRPKTEEIFLWLDDIRLPPIGWVWVKTAAEAIKVLQTGRVVECSLDHDLATEHYNDIHGYSDSGYVREPTGYAVVLWMAEHNSFPDIVRIHSMNPVGAKAMAQLVGRFRNSSLKPQLNFGAHEKYEPDEIERLEILNSCF